MLERETYNINTDLEEKNKTSDLDICAGSGRSEMVSAIPSKSFAHRAYICDFLAGGDGSSVICDLSSDDIRATRDCLDALRKEAGDQAVCFSGRRRGIETSGVSRAGAADREPHKTRAVLDCGESGSTLRFMLPLAGALGLDAKLLTRGRLSKRPMGELEGELIRHGMTIRHTDDGAVICGGKLEPGTFRLPGSVSSQYITGLLLALPYLEGDSRIELTSELQSSAYVDITIDVLKEYGIVVKTDHARDTSVRAEDTVQGLRSTCCNVEGHACKAAGDGSWAEEKQNDSAYTIYTIKGGQTYHRSTPYIVEGDWSQAAFWLAAGVIGKKPVTITGLKADSVQGDRRIVDVLRALGGRIEVRRGCEPGEALQTDLAGERSEPGMSVAGDFVTLTGRQGITAYPSEMKGALIDVAEIPDLAPAIACAAAAASGETRLTHAERLRLKESDRIESIVSCLNDIGITARGTESEIIIQGIGKPVLARGGLAWTSGDHRIVMMAAVLSLITAGEVVINGSSAVSKSYPAFFDEFERAGLAGNLSRL